MRCRAGLAVATLAGGMVLLVAEPSFAADGTTLSGPSEAEAGSTIAITST